ncbi:hypothetical protein CFP65_1480 [Kitasatospora sp. MMS16-BH015]|uniref:DUF2470 domain-containing protein n=1 Tax=Kitasatospora sp. MMS16-BH015 TaxID=2018025 RepID=UPI000CA0F01E|nr:DUF2470 domain-containing protein [Kitasatospora sp. MMS16-BH015]AUG76376.1 hypothetical protein CFP65_1480 [Kitasatospora sp. MMS16-BH015]
MPAHRPTAAERARTLVAHASSVVLDLPGIDLTERPGPPPLVSCAVLPGPGATLAVLVERSSPLHRITALARAEEIPGELDVVDVAPVALPHRIRARLGAQGRLSPLPATAEELDRLFPPHLFPHRAGGSHALLRFELDHLAVEDLWGSDCCIGLAAFTAARPDPVAAEEAGLLQHLASTHPEQLDLLAAQALDHPDGPGPFPVTAVRPVALDRHGLRVRLIGEQHVTDARFDFPHPLTGPEQLPDAMHRLFAHALR